MDLLDFGSFFWDPHWVLLKPRKKNTTAPLSSSRLISMHEASPDLVKSGLSPHHLKNCPQKSSDSSRQHPPPPERKKGALVSWQGIYISINLTTTPPKCSWTMETAKWWVSTSLEAPCSRNGFIQVKQPLQLVRSLGVRSVIKQNILRLVPSCVGPVFFWTGSLFQ